MGNPEDVRKPALPSWQQAQPTADKAGKQDKANLNAPEPATLEQARKFLQDEEVQKSSRERKAEFLKGKGVSQDDIDRLFSEEDEQGAQATIQGSVGSRSACPKLMTPC